MHKVQYYEEILIQMIETQKAISHSRRAHENLAFQREDEKYDEVKDEDGPKHWDVEERK